MLLKEKVAIVTGGIQGDEIFKEYGRIDILVNNVGLIRDNFLMLMSDEDWDSLLKTNLTSLFYCCRAVIRKMIPVDGRTMFGSSRGNRSHCLYPFHPLSTCPSHSKLRAGR